MPMQDRVKVFLIALLAVVVLIFIKIAMVKSQEDSWICQDGAWVRHGNPTTSKPTSLCRE